jgi:hypothetical protein
MALRVVVAPGLLSLFLSSPPSAATAAGVFEAIPDKADPFFQAFQGSSDRRQVLHHGTTDDISHHRQEGI